MTIKMDQNAESKPTSTYMMNLQDNVQLTQKTYTFVRPEPPAPVIEARPPTTRRRKRIQVAQNPEDESGVTVRDAVLDRIEGTKNAVKAKKKQVEETEEKRVARLSLAKAARKRRLEALTEEERQERRKKDAERNRIAWQVRADEEIERRRRKILSLGLTAGPRFPGYGEGCSMTAGNDAEEKISKISSEFNELYFYGLDKRSHMLFLLQDYLSFGAVESSIGGLRYHVLTHDGYAQKRGNYYPLKHICNPQEVGEDDEGTVADVETVTHFTTYTCDPLGYKGRHTWARHCDEKCQEEIPEFHWPTHVADFMRRLINASVSESHEVFRDMTEKKLADSGPESRYTISSLISSLYPHFSGIRTLKRKFLDISTLVKWLYDGKSLNQKNCAALEQHMAGFPSWLKKRPTVTEPKDNPDQHATVMRILESMAGSKQEEPRVMKEVKEEFVMKEVKEEFVMKEVKEEFEMKDIKEEL